jgi:hypothetical protein
MSQPSAQESSPQLPPKGYPGHTARRQASEPGFWGAGHREVVTAVEDEGDEGELTELPELTELSGDGKVGKLQRSREGTRRNNGGLYRASVDRANAPRHDTPRQC